MDEATNEVKDALSNLSLPNGAQDPQVTRISLNAMPVLALSISGANKTVEELTAAVEENVLPVLEGVEGVSDVQSGQQLKKVTIDFSEEKLTKYELTQETIQQIIQASNLTFPLGLTNFDGKVKNLVIDGNIVTIDDLKKLEIPAIPSQAGQCHN